MVKRLQGVGGRPGRCGNLPKDGESEVTLTTLQLTEFVTAWLWPFIRISAVVAVAPIFGNRSVPLRLRVGIAVVLTLVIAPLVPPMPVVDPISITGTVITGQQVLVGLSLGFAVRLSFIVLEVAGQQIAQVMGLGFAAMVDPQNGVSVPVVSQFYLILATLVFLALDGHLLVIEVLAESFLTLPVAVNGVERSGLWNLINSAGWVFSGAVLMALPAMGALLLVNLGFGVMSRSAPQLNIFAVGFPATLIFGFVMMLLTLSGSLALLEPLFERSIGMAQNLVSGLP